MDDRDWHFGSLRFGGSFIYGLPEAIPGKTGCQDVSGIYRGKTDGGRLEYERNFNADRRAEYGGFYKYFELDSSGEQINGVFFSWQSKEDDFWTYQDDDIYEFDGQTCTYEEWYTLTRKYLCTTMSGGEVVRDAVERTRYCTFKN